MKKIIPLLLFTAFTLPAFTQKKTVPATHSSLTGIPLPDGSKQDNRIISVVAAEMLLETESKKNNVTLSKTEVLVLPPFSSGGFNKDSLIRKLTGLGWNFIPVKGDEKYAWFQREKRSVIAYFSMDATNTSLYFSETLAGQPVEAEPPRAAQKQPEKAAAPVSAALSKPSEPVKTGTGGFQYSTTNFDDGWVSTSMDEWVEAVKGGIRVLLHYPTSKIDLSSSDYKTIANNAWNTLVAPRYSNLQNFVLFPGSLDYERPYFISGDVTDIKNGKKLYVVLFKRGDSGWIEIIAPDKESFVKSFGVDISKVDYYSDSSVWDPLKKMSYYNRFAVAASDLWGKWTNSFSGIQQYVNVYTAADAGMKSHSSVEVFEFDQNGGYKWELKVASGFVGSIKFEGVKSNGKMNMVNNWQVHFSDLEGKPKTYNTYFSCIKGARILWLEDIAYPTGFTGYAKSE
jgi:hypothetical protein